MRTLWLAFFCLTTLLTFPSEAKVSGDVEFSLAQVYSGALRYLRIERGYQITEKDAETAYVLFRYQDAGKKQTSFGAIEMVQRQRGVRLIVRLPELPSYHEQVLRDGLVRKLQEEYGCSGCAKPDKKRKNRRDDEKAPSRDGADSRPDRSQDGDRKTPDSPENSES